MLHNAVFHGRRVRLGARGALPTPRVPRSPPYGALRGSYGHMPGKGCISPFPDMVTLSML